jgi:hypothetical protein
MAKDPNDPKRGPGAGIPTPAGTPWTPPGQPTGAPGAPPNPSGPIPGKAPLGSPPSRGGGPLPSFLDPARRADVDGED